MPRFFVLVLCLIAFPAVAQTPYTIGMQSALAVDGDLSEWAEVEAVTVVPSADSVTTIGEFEGENDLAIRMRSAWNQEGLFFAIEWQDEVRDPHIIPLDSARWDSPLNRPLDRMYFYDNLVIRILTEERFYGVWMAPRTEEPYQWDVVRYNDGETDIAEEIKATRIHAQSTAEDRMVFEVVIPWDQIQWQPEAGLQFEMRLIIPDSDFPDLPLSIEKIRARTYIAQVFDVKLQGEEG